MRFNKISQLVTLTPNHPVSTYEQILNREGFTGGYYPIGGCDLTLDTCLSSRIPNLFFLKYGGIEQLCMGGVVSRSGKLFELKTAPRAAIGPDLKRVLIGANHALGRFKEITLHVFPLPEAQSWGLILVEHPEMAFQVVRTMLSLMIMPLVVRLLHEEESTNLLGELLCPEKEKLVFAFKLSGLERMVFAEKETLMRVFEGKKVLLYWPSDPEETLLDQRLLGPENFVETVSWLSPLWGQTTKSMETKEELHFRKHFRSK